ncbi:MAG TPA: hypothetical protein VFK30_11440 [Anaerolineae bacterium]|nr:hypothetical protein [Anaerolineae bacterium]
MPSCRFEPALVEAVVLAEIELSERRGDQQLLRTYHRAADPLYETTGADQLNAAFDELHSDFFNQLGFTRLIAATFNEFPDLQKRAPSLLVLAARSKLEEGAVIGRDSQSVCLRLLTGRFADRDRLGAFIRHELLHAADMLEAAFGYRVEYSESIGAANLLADRYRALWCAHVDARLIRRGLAPLADLETHYRDFAARFNRAAEPARKAAFAQLWQADRLTHAQITAIARQPDLQADHLSVVNIPGAPCPLCRFPTHQWAAEITPRVAAAIQIDFPRWQTEEGACERCVEVYALRLRMGVPT